VRERIKIGVPTCVAAATPDAVMDSAALMSNPKPERLLEELSCNQKYKAW
jgi:hypothetical protein